MKSWPASASGLYTEGKSGASTSCTPDDTKRRHLAGSHGGADGAGFVGWLRDPFFAASRIENDRSQHGGDERRDEDCDLGGGVVGGVGERLSRDEQRHRETDSPQHPRADQLA